MGGQNSHSTAYATLKNVSKTKSTIKFNVRLVQYEIKKRETKKNYQNVVATFCYDLFAI